MATSGRLKSVGNTEQLRGPGVDVGCTAEGSRRAKETGLWVSTCAPLAGAGNGAGTAGASASLGKEPWAPAVRSLQAGGLGLRPPEKLRPATPGGWQRRAAGPTAGGDPRCVPSRRAPACTLPVGALGGVGTPRCCRVLGDCAPPPRRFPRPAETHTSPEAGRGGACPPWGALAGRHFLPGRAPSTPSPASGPWSGQCLPTWMLARWPRAGAPTSHGGSGCHVGDASGAHVEPRPAGPRSYS